MNKPKFNKGNRVYYKFGGEEFFGTVTRVEWDDFDSRYKVWAMWDGDDIERWMPPGRVILVYSPCPMDIRSEAC